MVIHVRGSDELRSSTLIQQFVEKRYGRDLRLGRRLIGWNLNDTIVIRSEGLAAAQLQKYVRHFAPQRHVVFNSCFTPGLSNRYFAIAREMRTNYVFAFLDAPLGQAQALQTRFMEQIQSTRCEVVTLTPTRSVQQIEVLLMSAQRVFRSDEPLVLPEPTLRRPARSSARKVLTAA